MDKISGVFVAMSAGVVLGMGACVAEGDDLQIGSHQAELSNAELGVPLAIEFRAGGFVDQLLVDAREVWLDSEQWSLDIEITGLNGGFEHHGSDLIGFSEMTLFDTEQKGHAAYVIVDWTQDETPRNVNEVYTVCTQLVQKTGRRDRLSGDLKCQDFGPF